MKKLILVTFAFIIISTFSKAQNLYMCKDGNVSFFSETPVENIDAVSSSLNCILNTVNNEIVYLVAMRSFKFKKPLMQEHFNEKYVESDKYPNAVFKGKINEKINWTRDTVAIITSTGTFTIHGIDKPHTEKARLVIKNGIISIEGEFSVKVADHKIQIPKVVVMNIAEVISVKHSCNLTLYKAK